jgi:hypothetical protein
MSERVAPHAVQRVARAFAAGAVSILAFGGGGCSTEDGACAWLFAPTSFVDAGQPGCTAEPAGQTCDASTGRCRSICEPEQYLMTCRTVVVSGVVIPVEALQDPIVGSGNELKCTPVQLSGAASRNETAFCCQCAR